VSRWIGLTVGILLLTILAGAFGGWIGVHYGLRERQAGPGLDQVLHRDLDLTTEQHRRIARLEADFAVRHRSLETEMRAANRDLASAIGTEHAYGPAAERAVERFHAAMGELQKQTIIHVMTMRAVLDPAQAARFDQTVEQSLAPDDHRR